MSSFGAELKRERELREISLREVAEATKISLRHLEALERNDFTELPGGVFNRGFVRAYSQFIGVDPEAMVNAYLLEEQAQSGVPSPTDRVWRGNRSAPGDGADAAEEPAGRDRRRLLRWGLAALVLAGLLGLVYLVVRQSSLRTARSEAVQLPAAGRLAPADPGGDDG